MEYTFSSPALPEISRFRINWSNIKLWLKKHIHIVVNQNCSRNNNINFKRKKKKRKKKRNAKTKKKSQPWWRPLNKILLPFSNATAKIHCLFCFSNCFVMLNNLKKELKTGSTFLKIFVHKKYASQFYNNFVKHKLMRLCRNNDHARISRLYKVL